MVSGMCGLDGVCVVWCVEVGGKFVFVIVIILYLNMVGKCVLEILLNLNFVILFIVVVWVILYFFIIFKDFFYLCLYFYLLKYYVVYIVMKEGIKFFWLVDGGWSVW